MSKWIYITILFNFLHSTSAIEIEHCSDSTPDRFKKACRCLRGVKSPNLWDKREHCLRDNLDVYNYMIFFNSILLHGVFHRAVEDYKDYLNRSIIYMASPESFEKRMVCVADRVVSDCSHNKSSIALIAKCSESYFKSPSRLDQLIKGCPSFKTPGKEKEKGPSQTARPSMI